MRITILALGAPGDVQPVVALALGLERAGHRVRLAAPPPARDIVTVHGVEYACLGRLLDAKADRAADRWTTRSTIKVIRFYARRLFSKNLPPVWPVRVPFVERLMDDCWEACQNADIILLCRHLPWFYQVVEATGIPYTLWDIYPFTATQEFPSLHLFNIFRKWPGPAISASNWFRSHTGFNRWTHRLVERFLFDVSVRLTNMWLQERLKLPPVTNTTPFATRWPEPATLYAFSRVVAAPSDWPASNHLTGYWFLDGPEWQPPENLLQFLSAGPPPICFCFALPDPKNYLTTILATLAQTGHRAIVVAPSAGLGDLKVPDSVFVIDGAPHDWLFRQAALVVHQGDTTTTGEVLHAGVPSVVALSGRGMLFWADRLRQLGVSPIPIGKGRLSQTTLANAIRVTLDNPQFRERAIAVSRQVQAENGIAKAVELFERHLPQLPAAAADAAKDRSHRGQAPAAAT